MPLVVKRVDDGDLGVDFDGLAIEERWAIAPFAYCGESGRDEERVAANYLERLNGAVGRNDRVEFDAPFAAKLACQRRISRINAVNEHGVDHGLAHPAAFYGVRASRRRWLAIRVGRRQKAGYRRATRNPENFGTVGDAELLGRARIVGADARRD